jgi:hypothetical protein
VLHVRIVRSRRRNLFGISILALSGYDCISLVLISIRVVEVNIDLDLYHISQAVRYTMLIDQFYVGRSSVSSRLAMYLGQLFHSEFEAYSVPKR